MTSTGDINNELSFVSAIGMHSWLVHWQLLQDTDQYELN